MARQVPTVDGNVDLRIPPGTQPGVTLLMAKRGVPRLGAGSNVRGDQQVITAAAMYSTKLPQCTTVLTLPSHCLLSELPEPYPLASVCHEAFEILIASLEAAFPLSCGLRTEASVNS